MGKVTQVVAPNVATLDTDAKRALLKQLQQELKEGKASEKGAITSVKLEGDTLWIGVSKGTAPGAVGSGNNAGQPYLFQADGITFALDGANYKLGNIYAYKAKA